MAKDGSRAGPKNIRTPLAAQGMDSPVQPKLSVTRLWARRLLVRVDGLSMPSGLLLGVGIAGVCGYGFLRAGPQWGLGGAVLLLGTACTLALTGDAVAEPLPTQPAQPETLPEPLEMIELPRGEFWMGSPESEPGRFENELRHRVKVRAFAIGKYPVTQKQYLDVMGENPSRHQMQLVEGGLAEDRPVENVSWFDAVRFCNKLSQRQGRTPCYRITEPQVGSDLQPEVEWNREADGYRLPAEAEWEYACRAGTKTAYSFGNDEARLGEHAWSRGNSATQTHAAGRKRPNRWDLYDLHGNVREWCWDWYARYKVSSDTEIDISGTASVGPPMRSRRVVRGGSFRDVPRFLRSAQRYRFVPEHRAWDLGFRCVRNSDRQP